MSQPLGRKTAYLCFLEEIQKDEEKKNPKKKRKLDDISLDYVNKWKVMSREEKAKYWEMAEKDKIRYETEMGKYKPSDEVEDKVNKDEKKKKVKDPNAGPSNKPNEHNESDTSTDESSEEYPATVIKCQM